MRKFIISDIHGNGNVYYSIMGYLDNLSKNEDIELYINGDLFDRGLESGEILLDVIKRINDDKFKIVYLGGNHELLMYETYNKRKKGINTFYNDWYDNGGSITDFSLEELCNYDKNKLLTIGEFVGSLPLFHIFDEKMNGRNIALVHSACLTDIEKHPTSRIKDDDEFVNWCVWTREYDPFIPFRCSLGNKRYFSIVGHTPNDNHYGYEYHDGDNYLNIDGGNAFYVSGYFEYDHTPLVEVTDECLKILTFNNNNEIIYGNYFKGKSSGNMSEEELNIERSFLNKNLLVKKLIVLEDGVVNYQDDIQR